MPVPGFRVPTTPRGPSPEAEQIRKNANLFAPGGSLSNLTRGGAFEGGATPQRSKVGMPSLGDYLGGLGPAPTIAPPPQTYAASREGIDEAGADVNRFRGEYNAPTESQGFKDIMSLAGETTAAAVGEQRRMGSEAASRAGYTGGFNARAKQAESERMKAVAQAGFSASSAIREQALEGYGIAKGAATQLITEYNRANVQENMANADRTAQYHTQQAMMQLEHMGLATQAHQAYAGAKSEAQRLQAELDSQFQSQRIDAARYQQMSESVQMSFVAQMARLAEEARQFNVTQASRAPEPGSQEAIERNRYNPPGIG